MSTRLQPPPRCRRPKARAAAVPLVLVLSLALVAPAPAAAQVPVIDAAHIALNAYWHYVHYLQFAFQIYQHFTQIANQIEQIDNQLRALKKLANPNWRDIQLLLANLDSLVRSGTSIGYSLSNAGGQLRQVFPGWTPWSPTTTPANQSERSSMLLRAGLLRHLLQSQSFAPGEQTSPPSASRWRRPTATRWPSNSLAYPRRLFRPGAAPHPPVPRRQRQPSRAVSDAYWIDREVPRPAPPPSRSSPPRPARPTLQSTSAGFTFAPPGLALEPRRPVTSP